jgi:nucleotide-binding universal stress UspA family protein
MIQRLLFATDMGIHTHYLLHYVNSLAAQYNARVNVVHVMEPPGQMADALAKSYLGEELQPACLQDGIMAGVKSRIIDLLEDEYIDGQQGLSHIVDVKVLVGKPVEAIMQQANRCSADLIVLGSHGQDTAGANMLGSVSYRILQLSRVPVFMVPVVRTMLTRAKAG